MSILWTLMTGVSPITISSKDFCLNLLRFISPLKSEASYHCITLNSIAVVTLSDTRQIFFIILLLIRICHGAQLCNSGGSMWLVRQILFLFCLAPESPISELVPVKIIHSSELRWSRIDYSNSRVG